MNSTENVRPTPTVKTFGMVVTLFHAALPTHSADSTTDPGIDRSSAPSVNPIRPLVTSSSVTRRGTISR